MELIDASRMFIAIGWNVDESEEMLAKPIPPGEEAYLPIALIGYEADNIHQAKMNIMIQNPDLEISHVYCLADMLKTVDTPTA